MNPRDDGGALERNQALQEMAELQQRADHGMEAIAYGFKQGVAAERARLRAAVEGLYQATRDYYGAGPDEFVGLNADAVLALLAPPTYGEPYAFNCTVPGCTVEGHHR